MVLYNSIRRCFAFFVTTKSRVFWWNNPFGVIGESEACLTSITDIFAIGMYVCTSIEFETYKAI